jgi:hypothetical protein
MQLPSAIILTNSTDTGSLQKLSTQFSITETISLNEFNDRVNAEPEYPSLIHLNGLRLLITSPDFSIQTNRLLMDVVIFVKNGLASVQKNNFGPPGLTFPIDRINMYELLRYVGSNQVVILPVTATKPPHTCGHGCGCCLGGILAIQSSDTSGVHCPNPDNIYNNPDFINRK